MTFYAFSICFQIIKFRALPIHINNKSHISEKKSNIYYAIVSIKLYYNIQNLPV